MANQLDDVAGPVMSEGRDINVIAKKIEVKVGIGSKLFEIALWIPSVVGLVLMIMSLTSMLSMIWYVGAGILAVGLIIGFVYMYKKTKAGNYLMQQEQKIQQAASSVDNYLEQRVQILQNAAVLVQKAVDLDKSTYTQLAALRAGALKDLNDDDNRNELSLSMGAVSRWIRIAVENYPELKSHGEINEAMRQNSVLQKEITAAREVYNDAILRWNTIIFIWPCKMIVAAKRGYTTRIPFTADAETKERARSVFF